MNYHFQRNVTGKVRNLVVIRSFKNDRLIKECAAHLTWRPPRRYSNPADTQKQFLDAKQVIQKVDSMIFKKNNCLNGTRVEMNLYQSGE